MLEKGWYTYSKEETEIWKEEYNLSQAALQTTILSTFNFLIKETKPD